MFGSYVTHDSDYLARTVGRPAPTVGTKLRIGGFRDATGELLISKSKVSEITDPLCQDYQAFITPRLVLRLARPRPVDQHPVVGGQLGPHRWYVSFPRDVR